MDVWEVDVVADGRRQTEGGMHGKFRELDCIYLNNDWGKVVVYQGN